MQNQISLQKGHLMISRFIRSVGTTIAAGCLMASMVHAQNDRKLLIIYDSSNSMWGELADGSRKYEAGRTALGSIIDQGFGGRDIGFRAYGHRQKNDCRDSQLVAPFAAEADAGPAILDAANAIRPTGKTPITYSLTEGLKDFGNNAGEILLISDGLETCDADPCALMAQWQDRDVEVRVHVVGVGLDDVERAAMACIAETSGGTYLDADSTDSFVTALQDVGEVIEAAEAPKSRPVPTPQPDVEPEQAVIEDESNPDPDGLGYAIVYQAVDAGGHEYLDARGQLFRDGVLIDNQITAKGRGRNVVESPGEYELLVGVVLKDGSIYEPRRFNVTVSQPGNTETVLELAAPARVAASFTENGEPHEGALVSAFQNGTEVFRFRAQDTALARPGDYEFRAVVNQDNVVVAQGNLVAGQLTTVAFELVQTVRAYVEFVLTDGTILRRNSTLSKDEVEVYRLHSSNGADVKPGRYFVKSDDQNLPLVPTEIVIGPQNESTYRLDLPAGWITVTMADQPENYFNGRVAGRSQQHSVDRGNWSHTSPGQTYAVAPGNYEVRGFEKDGIFAPVPLTVASGDRINVTLTPAPLGEVVVRYAPSENYLRSPDRASAAALDGQPLVNSFLRPGEPAKLAPGRYQINGRSNAGDIPPVQVTILPGQRAEVTLRLAGE